jgi:hydroxypyruvate isomerase
MPRFAANLSMLFDDVPFLDRFERAARAGFTAVEYQFPYTHPVAAIRERLDAHDLVMVLQNLPAGNAEAGDRGIACLPDRVDEFRRGVQQGIAYAKALGVPQINCLAGKAPAGVERALLRRTLVDNLRYAAAEFAHAGLNLLVEPINFYDVPGFFINTAAQTIDVLDEVGAANAHVQFDIYHAQRMHGELAATIDKYLPRIAHMQLADNPGRHEPGSGEINFDFLFAHIDRIGYRGWIGCEYRPAGRTEAGLGWRDRWSTGR